MNGLKGINDEIGHDGGDLAVRGYFQAISTALRDRGEAYRVGGDEVIALLPRHNSQMASTTLRTACLSLMREQLKFQGQALPRLSASVGIATTVEPGKSFMDLRRCADQTMYRAKEEAHKRANSVSAIAVDGDTQVCIVDSNVLTGRGDR
jgi:diguanylate cyclase (GGDEF)-like protein